MVAHKWTSRVMFLHAVVHSITYTCYPFRISGWETYITYYQDVYFIWGVVATVLGGFILLFAMPQLRRAFYDIFLYTHIVLVVLFTVGCWYHVYLIEDHENMAWLYACFAIWAYDRIARLVRVIYYNVLLVTTRSKILRKVHADIISGTDCIRLTVDANKAGLCQRVPGVFVYIYIPSVYFWQSHPFTIASWYQPSIDLPSPQSALKSIHDKTVATTIDAPFSVIEKKSKECEHSTSTSSSSISSDQQGITSISSSKGTINSTTFELLIRPQQGMTKKLYEKIEKEGRDGCDIYVVIEGPYGHTHPILQYDTAILIAGGVGTTATVPYLQEAVYNARNMAVRHLVFIWVVQYEDQLKWSQDAIEKCILHLDQQQQQQQKILNDTNDHDIADIQSEKTTLALDVSIYVTRSTAPTDKSSKNKLQGLSISYGVRPDLNKQIGKYIDMASGNSVAVLHCGPVRMSDQIRQITVDNGIPYFEEAFDW
ncbi:ferric reductase NAD binding domain-containing protein [Cunninghamella echinulata]|nr:ferric reductase NAD binding domain-containing protein [Cunninghamella echinulata]